MSESSSNHTLSKLMANINNDKDRLFLVSSLLSQMEEPFDPFILSHNGNQKYKNIMEWCFYQQDLECFTLFVQKLKQQNSEQIIINNIINNLFKNLSSFDYCNTFNDYLSVLFNNFQEDIIFSEQFKEDRLEILNKCFSEHLFDSIDYLIKFKFVNPDFLSLNSNELINKLFERDISVNDYFMGKIFHLINQGITPATQNSYDNKTLIYSLYCSNQINFEKHFLKLNLSLQQKRTSCFADTISNCCLEPDVNFENKMEHLIVFYRYINLPEEDINDVLKKILSNNNIMDYCPFINQLQKIQIELEKKFLSSEMNVEKKVPLKRL